MNRDIFIEYLNDPEVLDVKNLEELRGILKEYPYFQTAHMLLVKTLNNLQDLRFSNQLKFSAAHIGNRHILFNLVNQHHFAVIKTGKDEVSDQITAKAEKPSGGSGKQESLADIVLKEVEEMKASGPSEHDTAEGSDTSSDILILDEQADIESDQVGESAELTDLGSEAHSFSEWLEMLGTSTDYLPDDPEKQPSGRRGNFDLIDRFLLEKPRIEPRSPLEDGDSPVDMSVGSIHENDEFFTETLAKIYVQQKHYRKAIYAYEKLSLKYPEKYSYFADQIDEIKRLIN